MITQLPFWILTCIGIFIISMVISFFGDCTGEGSWGRNVTFALFVTSVFVVLDYFDIGITLSSWLGL